jgi:SpoVK/Ycf46/Vps4 family AAA+-type ATPase
MSSNLASKEEITQQLPLWYEEYRTSFLSSEAHAFILHRDLEGYAYELLSQRRFLISTLARTRPVIACYNIATGIWFPDEAMRKEALRLLRPAGEEVTANLEVDPFEQALAGIGSPDSAPEDPFSVNKPFAALQVLEQLLRVKDGKGKVAVILDYADKLMPAQDKGTMADDARKLLVLLQSWGVDRSLGNTNNPVFLLTRDLDDLHKDIRSRVSGYKAIEIPLPGYDERLAFVRFFLNRRVENKKKAIPLVDITAQELARLTAGLNLKNLEDLLLLAAKAEGVTSDLVKKVKDEIIATEYRGLVEIIDPLAKGFAAVGGMDKTIAWFKDEIIAPIRAGESGDIPKGILLVGPPGSGKTFMVRALAREIGFNAIALNAENILGGIVGTSERNLKTALELARSISPVLLFVDEIDQSDMSRRGNTSGNPVASNLFSALLRFMGDPSLRGKVIVFFASNRPDLLDSALTRFGRIDETIPVRLADEKGRLGIVYAQADLQQCSIEEGAAEYIAKTAVKFSGADLEAVVAKARKLAKRRASPSVMLEDAQQAMRHIRPETPRIADYYTLLAIQACKDTELLEPNEIALLEDPTVLKRKMREAKATIPANLTKPEEEREERSE